MIYLVIILSLLVVVLGYTTFNLLKKNEKAEDAIISYQEYINGLGNTVEFMTKRIDEVDAKGTFKSDDEVGFFFQAIKQLQDILNEFQLRKY